LDPIQHLPGKLPLNVSSLSAIARPLTHGVATKQRSSASEVLNPKPIHPLLKQLEENKEKNYNRKEHQPLGKSRSGVQLPEFTADRDFKFGRKTELSESAAKMMDPHGLAIETEEIHRQYVKSHKSYKPGEKKSHYDDDKSCALPFRGEETVMINRLNNDGSRVKESLYWQQELERELKTKLSTSRLAAFRETHKPELGKVHDPYIALIKD
jgi:hypothetical protein